VESICENASYKINLCVIFALGLTLTTTDFVALYNLQIKINKNKTIATKTMDFCAPYSYRIKPTHCNF